MPVLFPYNIAIESNSVVVFNCTSFEQLAGRNNGSSISLSPGNAFAASIATKMAFPMFARFLLQTPFFGVGRTSTGLISQIPASKRAELARAVLNLLCRWSFHTERILPLYVARRALSNHGFGSVPQKAIYHFSHCCVREMWKGIHQSSEEWLLCLLIDLNLLPRDSGLCIAD